MFAPDALRETLGEGGALREEAREARLANMGEFGTSAVCGCCWCEDAETEDASFEVSEGTDELEVCRYEPLTTGAPETAGAAFVVDAPVLSALSRCGLFML